MRIAVTGTPGVGKTSACSKIRRVPVYHVNDLVEMFGLANGYDRKRKTKEVDVRKLAKRLEKLEGCRGVRPVPAAVPRLILFVRGPDCTALKG